MEAVGTITEVAHELGAEIFYLTVTRQLLLHGVDVGADTSVRRGGEPTSIVRGLRGNKACGGHDAAKQHRRWHRASATVREQTRANPAGAGAWRAAWRHRRLARWKGPFGVRTLECSRNRWL